MRPEHLRILIVDGDANVRERLTGWLQADGFNTAAVPGGEAALRRLREEPADFILTAARLPDMNSLELLRQVKLLHPAIEVAVMTADAGAASAMDVMRLGAIDYLVPPLEREAVELAALKFVKYRSLADENARLKANLAACSKDGDLPGRSSTVEHIRQVIVDAAATDVPVLITGESGSGKEQVARAIHLASPRRGLPMVIVSCGAIPDHRADRELFGCERGSPDTAPYPKRGRLELAVGGTLFLDNVSALPAGVQRELGQVLQRRTYTRVDGTQELPVDCRVIAADNRDLAAMTRSGEFREDLYLLLGAVQIHIPPLRDRREDILLMAEYFLRRICAATNKKIVGFSEPARQLLQQYHWPGNTRELENAVERAVVVTASTYIQPLDLPPLQTDPATLPASLSLEELERRHLLKVLPLMKWNIKKAAEVLGVERTTLYNKIRRYGITRPSRR